MQLQGTRHVADKAGGTDGHITRIAGCCQYRYEQANNNADKGKTLLGIKGFHKNLLSERSGTEP